MQLSKNHFNSRVILSVLGLCVFFAALRWNRLNIPFIRDEGEYAYAAWLLRQNILPYVNSFMQKPPMIIYTYVLAQWINPSAYWSPRILACISIIFGTILLGLIARREFGKGVGLIVIWIVTPMILLPGWQEVTANTEAFLFFPFMGTLACYIWKRSQASAWHWLLAGIFGGLAILYRPNIMPMILFIAAAWIVETWFHSRNIKILLKNGSFGILGGIFVSILALAYFLMHNGWTSLLECTLFFNRYYAQSSLANFGFKWFIHIMKTFWSQWWILYVLLVYFLIKRPVRWWFYIGLFMLSILGNFAGWHHRHSYIILIPFWALIVSVSISMLVKQISQKIHSNSTTVKIILVVIVLFLICWPNRKSLFILPSRFNNIVYYNANNPFRESAVVAEHVSKMTSPDDYVFIAGSEPQILYYARRKSPTRFVITYPFMIGQPIAFTYQEEVINDLKNRPPKVIVVATSYLSWRESIKYPTRLPIYLSTLLDDKYILIGGFKRDRNSGYWQEPLHNDQIEACSLLVYKKKR